MGSKKSIDIFNSWLRESGYPVEIRISEAKTPPSGQGANSYYIYSFMPIDEEAAERGKPSRTVGYSMEHTNVDIHRRHSCEDITEDNARGIISEYLGIPLYKEKVDINGKLKEFDLVNFVYKVVGDFKRFQYKGSAEAEMSNLAEYVWLMEKLEKYTSTRWRKIIVGAGNRKIFETFARRYDPWLEDVEIYYITPSCQVVRIR